LRRKRALTQAEMAAELGVSPSYVNLVERNQRPISADLLVRLAQAYDLDLSALAGEGSDDLFATLNDAFSDPMFKRAGVTREDAHELAAGNPVLGEAVAALYRAWRNAQGELIEARASGRSADADPVEEARTFLQANRNHFPALDEAGEAIASGADPLRGGLIDVLVKRFDAAHRLRVRILPADVMAGALRRHNRHAGEIAISEALDQASRAFHLALQLVLLEQSPALDRVVNDASFQSDAGRRLARAALANYAAASILMPYARFHTAAEEFRYDIEALSRRFGASFEQATHRLTTLQRKGAEGIPFFFLRVDAAGNVSKRYSADVFPFARYGGSCPLWNVHDAFKTPRRIVTQIIELPDGDKYFSIARTVHGETAGYGSAKIDRAVALGCALKHAPRLIYAQGLNLETATAAPIGVNCRLCERPDCAARAHPPLRRMLVIDEHKRLATPFSFAFD
jgi:predicted transcriptional regulator/DNA-binding XRE family transcriptional regulator